MLVRSTRVMAVVVAAVARGEKVRAAVAERAPAMPSHRPTKAAAKNAGTETKTPTKRGAGAGELTARLLLLVVLPGYVLIYLTGERPWLWYVYGGAWLFGCFMIAAIRGDGPSEVPAEKSARRRPQAEKASTAPVKEGADTSEEHATENDHEMAESGEGYQEAEHDAPAAGERERRIRIIQDRVEELVAAAVHEGKKGARTLDILAAFQARGGLHGWEEKPFRELLRSIGIPIRDQMYFKINGEKTNHPGVHVEDLTEHLGRAPLLPAHLVPDLTPVQAVEPTSSPAPLPVQNAPPRGE
ncbi:hypothetical protein [Streptomyces sp. MP131-18]|uniref:hypothetical protein n=1 Tax=Streptomyces sp. MP131-18 TaxID=1857892 RepID=UPI00117D5789|nr:hypothetical protein [Streptomyces sp. MP131-18]